MPVDADTMPSVDTSEDNRGARRPAPPYRETFLAPRKYAICSVILWSFPSKTFGLPRRVYLEM
jgi:hypothetical protein